MLKTTSYRDYLIKICGCSDEVANCFQGRTLGFFALGCDAVPAAEREIWVSRLCRLGLPASEYPEWQEPYIYHFPDGNASLARLLVRALVPGVAPGDTMDDVVLAPFDYAALDRERTTGPYPPRFDLHRCAQCGTSVSWSVIFVRERRIGSTPNMSCSPASTW